MDDKELGRKRKRNFTGLKGEKQVDLRKIFFWLESLNRARLLSLIGHVIMEIGMGK